MHDSLVCNASEDGGHVLFMNAKRRGTTDASARKKASRETIVPAFTSIWWCCVRVWDAGSFRTAYSLRLAACQLIERELCAKEVYL